MKGAHVDGLHYCSVEEYRVVQCSTVGCRQGKVMRGDDVTSSLTWLHIRIWRQCWAVKHTTPHHATPCRTMPCHTLAQIHHALSHSAELQTHHYNSFLPFIRTCPSLFSHLSILLLPLPLPHWELSLLADIMKNRIQESADLKYPEPSIPFSPSPFLVFSLLLLFCYRRLNILTYSFNTPPFPSLHHSIRLVSL